MGTFLKVIGGCVVAVGVAISLLLDLLIDKIRDHVRECDGNAAEDEPKTV